MERQSNSLDSLTNSIVSKAMTRRDMLRRTIYLGLSVPAVVSLLSACSDDEDDAPADDSSVDETPDDDEVAEPADDTPDEADDEEAEPDAAEGDIETVNINEFENPPAGTPSGEKPEELVIAYGSRGTTVFGLDPQRHSNSVAESRFRHIYEPLVALDSDLETLVPVLATQWERIDELTVQFELREGVTFHNGEEFNAEAVQFSVLRPISEETPGAVSYAYESIDDVEIVDDYTVNIKTSVPDPALLRRMTGFHMTIIAPGWASEDPEGLPQVEAVGTGPYKYVSHEGEHELVVEANEDYWNGAPNIKRVRMTTIPEMGTRVAALRAGDVHIAQGIPPEEFAAINDSGRARVVRTPSNRVPAYGITAQVAPYDDVRVRQAINYAANVDGVIEAILYGNGVRISTIMPTWTAGFDPSLEPYPHDPERARELLEEAGYPDGLEIDVWYQEGRYLKDREVIEAMCQEMEAAGIRCNLNLLEGSVLSELQAARETPGLNFGSWGNWIFDADNSLTPIVGCDQARAERGQWRGTYGCNEELEALLDEARIELDEERRLELYAEAQQLIYDDAALLFMYQVVDTYGVDNWVLWEPRPDEAIWAHEMKWNE